MADTEASAALGKSEAWFVEIDAALKREEKWRKRGKAIVSRYRDERAISGTVTNDTRINILWANTEILRAALYSRTANPDVRRRFPDAQAGNSVSRTVAEILERSLNYCADAYDSDTPISSSVEDMLLPGRGVVWVVYDPEITEGPDGQEQIANQELREEWVYWQDFCHGHSRSWVKVPWVARRLPMRKREFEEKFPDARADRTQATYSMEDNSSEGERGSTEGDKFVEVWEIWNKSTKRRVYVGRGYSDVLQEDDDPLGLRDFFPCAQPLYSVKTTDSMIPVPEFAQYQDQANELDRISTRITALLEQLKVRGIYDGSVDGENVLSTIGSLGDGEFVAYRNWAALADKGGIEAALGFWPLAAIIATLKELYIQRATLVQQIFEITGISDIVRGSTDPRETKGAQQLKAQFGSMRIQRRQKEVQRFIRDTYRIKAEIIAEHFTQETLAAISGVKLPTAEQKAMVEAKVQQVMGAMPAAQAAPGAPPQGGPQQPPQLPPEVQSILASPTWEEVMEVMRSDKLRGYRVDIETDSTVMVDAEAEKASRVEFMEAFVPLMASAVQAAMTAPQTLPLIKEAVLFAIRTFKAGRSMEQAVEDVFQQLTANPPQPPEQQKAEGDGGAAAMADVQRKAERDKAEMTFAGAKTQADIEASKAETQQKSAKLAFEIRDGMAQTALKAKVAAQRPAPGTRQ